MTHPADLVLGPADRLKTTQALSAARPGNAEYVAGVGP